jgi:hypothetical protein
VKAFSLGRGAQFRLERTLCPQSCRCDPIDGRQGAFSCHAPDRQNPVDLEKLAADIPVPYLNQDEPS